MFFRSRSHQPARDNPRVADVDDAGTDETTLRQSQQMMEWRRSAQRVTRAWDAWLAAESRDRATRYRTFVAALADEETAAAEIECNLVTTAGRRARIDAQTSGLGAR